VELLVEAPLWQFENKFWPETFPMEFFLKDEVDLIFVVSRANEK